MGRPPKRKVSEDVSSAVPTEKKDNAPGIARKRQKIEPTASSTRPRRNFSSAINPPQIVNDASANMPTNKSKKDNGSRKKTSKTLKNGTHPAPEDSTPKDEDQATQTGTSVVVSSAKKKSKARANTGSKAFEQIEEEANDDGRQFWLMKAEPESRIEKGRDVKFSIDDLKAATSPEPWDGVRNLEARNNIRAMIKGDLAFFYHSNCKTPGIVGTMVIVQEHTVDESAFDPEHPYYDEKSSRDNPKWHVVHVAFRQKFPEIIRLKDLQKFAKDRGKLENMQTLKRSRLSVSKVSKIEWDFILSLVDEEDDVAQDQPVMSADDSALTADMDYQEGQAEAEAVNGNVEGTGSDDSGPTKDMAAETVT